MNEEMRKEFENMVASGDLIPDLFSGCIMYANRVKMVADASAMVDIITILYNPALRRSI